MIIGEAGTSHKGSLEKALDYVDAAIIAGADAVKFQIFDAPTKESMFCWIDGDEERSQRWIESRLSLDEWMTVKDWCDINEIDFLASVFEYETVKWLTELEVKATKVASRAAGYLSAFKAQSSNPLGK